MSEELKAALARIACLEGEIAKRDETIARLEPQLNRAIQANYDLREELAACRVAVENCEVFRARIAELEAKYLELASLSSRISVELPIAYALPVSEAKAQGVVQWPEADEIMQMAFEEGQPADDASGYCFELEEFDLFIERLMSEVARLNAAPVSEAEAQGDAWAPSVNDYDHSIHSNPDAKEWADFFVATFPGLADKHDLMIGWFANAMMAMHDHLARKAQGVVMPEPMKLGDAGGSGEYGAAMIRGYNACLREVARLNAAPSAPAADAGLVEALELAANRLDRLALEQGEFWRGYATMWVREARAALAAHRAKGVV